MFQKLLPFFCLSHPTSEKLTINLFISSYDLRGKNAEKAATWKDTEILGSDRAYFITISQPATLSISNIEESEDVYKRQV